MAEKLIDMHMHTYYSDGDLSPNELIEKAINNNIGTMAITDHNTIEGLRNFDNSYKDKIEIINGIELSAKSLKGTMHVLGYDIDIENKSLNDKMHELKNNSFQREISLIEQLKKDYTIIIVTHSMQQASRVSDETAFFLMGELIECDKTTKSPQKGTVIHS